MIRTSVVPTREVADGPRRLDAFYYAGGGRIARQQLELAGVRLQRLDEVAKPPYMGLRFARYYVKDRSLGKPFLGPSDIQLADLSRLPFVSRVRTPFLEDLRIRPGWILISRSGVIGNFVYVREDMDGLIGSDDLIRIEPRSGGAPLGYLLTFLRSSVGIAMLRRSTYGAVIQHIEPFHVAEVPVPRLDDSIEEAIHKRIEAAAAKRVEANRKLREADLTYLTLVGLPEPLEDSGRPLCFSAHIGDGLMRFDAPHYNPQAMWVRRILEAHPCKRTMGEITTEVFHPFRMNIRYVEPENGIPFINGGDIIDARPKPAKWISRRLYMDSRFVVKPGWSLATNAGTIGFDAYVGRSLDGLTMAQHVTRFVPNEAEVLPEFLYAIIRSLFTRVQMRSLIYGSVIDTVLEDHMAWMLAACPEKHYQREVAYLIAAGTELREEANDLEDEAQAMLERALDEATGGAWSGMARRN